MPATILLVPALSFALTALSMLTPPFASVLTGFNTPDLVQPAPVVVSDTVIATAPVAATDASATPRWYWAQDDEHLALRGYDVVAYHLLGSPTVGAAEHEVSHEGIRYRFANADHRARFVASPESYLPKYGGWCAWSVGVPRQPGAWPPRRVPVDPENFLIAGDDELLLFARGPGWDMRQQWLAAADAEGDASLAAHRARGDAFWAQRIELGEQFPRKPDGLHRLAPMETAQFDFFIGHWRGEFSYRVGGHEHRPHERGQRAPEFQPGGDVSVPRELACCGRHPTPRSRSRRRRRNGPTSR